MDPASITSQVARAFPVDPVPTRESLFNPHCDECVDVSNAFGGRQWVAIDLQDIVGKETALLTPAAWRYYLPALITWCVREPEALDVLPDYLVYQLEPPQPPKTDEWFQERKDGFSSAQRDAIIAYLEWYREREEAEYAELEMETPRHVYRALAYWKSVSEDAVEQ